MIRIPKSREKGVGAVELLEQATALLRSTPLATLACYYLGTLPFLLGLLWFWADMSRSADAHLRLAGGALALALLFVWMKVWQARFAGLLLTQLGGQRQLPALAGTIMVQAGLQPWGFIILPLAALLTLPLCWCFAFFQNITVLGGPDSRSVQRKARRLALLWPGQNHLLVTLLALISLVLFINIALGAFFLPRLLKMLFGIESLFTRSNLMLLNSTFWAAVAAATHLCTDPLSKACYVLRCHYGESLASGADLRAQLKALGDRSMPLILALAMAAVLGYSAQALSAEPQPVAQLQQRAAQLDHSIEQVIASPRFAWRLPREGGRLEKQELPGFLRASLEWLQDAMTTVGGWIKHLTDWLAKKLPRPKLPGGGNGRGAGFGEYALALLYGLLALLLAGAAIFAWRHLRRGNRQQPQLATRLVTAEPDLNDEALTADELSEDRWAALARELLVKGDVRLGLRAMYLATLACLAEARLLVIIRCKTNHDYERELLRFSHAMPGVSEAFSLNLRIFEGAWYGMHLPDQGTLQQYLDNHARIRSELRAQ